MAERFDLAPDYDMNNIRFMTNNRPATAYDNMGITAIECIVNLLETYKNETLTTLWTGITEGQDPWEAL